VKEKIFLVIGGGEYQLPLIEKVKKRGFKAWVADMNPDCPGKKAADFFIQKSTRDEEGIVAELHKNLKPHQNLSGVATLGTDVPRTVARVAMEFSLPSVDYKTAVITTDKEKTRKTLNASRLPAIKYLSGGENDIEHLLKEAFRFFEEDFLVKPVDNSGARGVRLIKKDEGFEEAINKVKSALNNSPQKRVILEEYLDGVEFSMDAIVVDEEKIYVMDIADRNIVLQGSSFIEVGHTVPTRRLNFSMQKRAEEILKKAIKTLGITKTGVNADIKYSYRHGDFVVLEIASRLSGDKNASHTIPIAHGLDPVDYLIDIATGDDPSKKIEAALEPDGTRKLLRWAIHRALMLTHKIGKVVRKILPDEEALNEICEDWGLWLKEKDPITESQDNPSRHGYVIVSDHDYTKALHKAEKALKILGRAILH